MYNYGYLPNDYYINSIQMHKNNYRNNGTINNDNLYTPEEGYIRGNLFMNLYDGYKNYQPQSLKASNEEEAMFLELSKYAFAMHELKLYLDLHPENKSMLLLFNDYSQKAKKLIDDYEKKYGPMTEFSDNFTSSFSWCKTPWPWEGGMY